MASPQTDIYWADVEVEIMLQYMHSLGDGARLMSSTNLKTTIIFQSVARKPGELIFEHLASHCRVKFKREKAIFCEGLKEW